MAGKGDSLPPDEAGLTDWLHARFQEKDELLEGYYATGVFEDTAG